MKKEGEMSRSVMLLLFVIIVLVIVIIVVLMLYMSAVKKVSQINEDSNSGIPVQENVGVREFNKCLNVSDERERINCQITFSTLIGNISFCSSLKSDLNFSILKNENIIDVDAKDYCLAKMEMGL